MPESPTQPPDSREEMGFAAARVLAEDSIDACPETVTGLRIVVVDDNDDCAESTAVMLRLFGHGVQIARNGGEAIAVIESATPDLVLLDLGLPGMSGYEVARHINAQSRAKRPILIAVTGFGRETDRHLSAQAGIDMHLVKPVDPLALETLLRKLQKEIDPSKDR